MHFDILTKVTHNEDAIREYNRAENQRIKRGLKRLALLAPIILLLTWLFLRLR